MRRWFSLACAAAVATALPEGLIAQEEVALSGTVIVLNKQGNDASFIDLESRAIVATVPTGPGPHELVITSDGRTAVGTDYGGRTLTVIDVVAASVTRTIDLGEYTRPHGIVVLPGDSLVAVTSESRGAVVIVRISDGALVEVLETEAGGSHMVAATADGSTLWTGDMSSNTVSELRRGASAPIRALSAPARPEAVNVTPDGTRVFAGSNTTGRITAWTTATGEPRTIAEGFGWPYRVFLTPGVEQIVIPDLENEVVRFFDGSDYRELGQMEFPDQAPQGLVLHADGRHLFLSLSGADRIAVIDLSTRETVATLPAGNGPDGIAWSPLPVVPGR